MAARRAWCSRSDFVGLAGVRRRREEAVSTALVCAPRTAPSLSPAPLPLPCPLAEAAPWRNTARSTSGRSSSSEVRPLKRISPFSMNRARLARRRARLTDCSTRITVVPLSWMASTMPSSRSTTVGARPRDSSSMSSSRGRAMKACPRLSICCSPPDRLPAGVSHRSRRMGKYSRTRSVASRRRGRSLRYIHPAARMFSPTVRVGNTPRPPGTCTIPSPDVCLASAWVMSRPSKKMEPPMGSTSPLMPLRRVDFPAPLVPRRARISPFCTSKLTSKRTCTRS